MSRTLLIAEAGVNHNGNLDLACALVDAAAACGADVIKFQTFDAGRLATASAPKAAYQARATDRHEGQQDMLRRLELTLPMHEALIARSRAAGIRFLSTAFDIESLDTLASLGVEQFKIPSGELTNLPFLRHVARFGKPIVMSTGMATLDEVGAALAALERAGAARSLVTVLQCTTEYPAPMGDVNLRAMLTIRDTFDVAVGYSDHTAGIEAAVAAVALGASIVEKHLTLDRAMPGPDHGASLEPEEFRSLVSAIRNVEQALGSGVKAPAAGEVANREVARKSLVAARPIKVGEPFAESNLTAKRPGTGVSPMRWDDVIGRRAPRDFAADEAIEL